MTDALDELAADLRGFEAIRRSPTPLQVDPATGVCSLFTYDDVSTALRDTDVYSNTPPGAPYESQHAMLFTDPPRHRELRGLVSKAFTPSAIARLEGRLGEIMDGLLAEVSGTATTVDVVPTIADPLPEIMIAEMLGVGDEYREEFKRWSRSFSIVVTSQAQSSDGLEEHLRVLNEMFDYFDGVIEDRRKAPRDDMITGLVQAEENGQRLSAEELRATCAQLLAAGNETTTNLIGNAIICLAQRPYLVAEARSNPAVIPGVVEETLRFLAPVQFVPRYCKKAVTLHGHTIVPGTPVLAMLASANRDRATFEDPDRFDWRRTPNRHLGLGFGVHFCLGAALARLEAKVAIERMLVHLPGTWSIADALERIPDEPFFFGVASLALSSGS